MSMYICKVNFNSSTCLLPEICVFFVYRQLFCTSTWTWMHLQKNLQVPGMDGRGICGRKNSLWDCFVSLQIWCFFFSKLPNWRVQQASCVHHFQLRHRPAGILWTWHWRKCSRQGGNSHYGFPTEISKPEFLGWLQGHPKGKPKGAPDILTGEMEKWTSVEILSTSRIFGDLEFFFFAGKKIDGFSPTPRVFLVIRIMRFFFF